MPFCASVPPVVSRAAGCSSGLRLAISKRPQTPTEGHAVCQVSSEASGLTPEAGLPASPPCPAPPAGASFSPVASAVLGER